MVLRFHKKSVIFLVLLLGLCLCFCGCGGKISTSEAQNYLDGENDVAVKAEEKVETVAEETDPGTVESESPNNSADMSGGNETVANNVSSGQNSSGSSSSGNSSSGNSDSGSSSSSDVPAVSDEPAPSAGNTATETKNQCTIAIDCKTILNNTEKLNSAKKSFVPSDGVILPTTTVTFHEGDTVIDVLKKVTREKGIQMEFEDNPIYGTAYVEGIGNLYEFDCGDLSGWEYCVNGWYPNYGCSNYVLENGDVILWRFTCNLGKDL